MKIIETKIQGLLLIEPTIHKDDRGWFMESYNAKQFKTVGIDNVFVQSNHLYSTLKGTIRGLHFQDEPYAQTKLVRCTVGRIWDVAVDLRKDSQTFGHWCAYELSALNQYMFLIPKGFAHGFITLEDDTEVQYKVDNYYYKNSEITIDYADPDINIEWNCKVPILSEKDKKGISFKDWKCVNI